MNNDPTASSGATATMQDAAPASHDAERATDATVPASGIVGRCRSIADSTAFQNFILAVIGLNAALIGVETSSTLQTRFGGWFNAFNLLVQAIFTVEIAIRLTAYWPRPLRFFRGGWNIFDFVVVAIAFVPATGGLSNLARLARVARATRIVSALPRLRLVIETLVHSMPSIAHILALLGLFLYVYAIVGFNFFAAADPDRWGSLGVALFTLFQVMTLENWPDIYHNVAPLHPWSWFFFASFILVAVLVITNLVVAVIIKSMEAAKQADAERFDLDVPGNPMARISEIRHALARLERDVRAASEEIRDSNRDPSA